MHKLIGLAPILAFTAALGAQLPASPPPLAIVNAADEAPTFRDTFTGNPSSPQRFQSPDWDVSLSGNRVETTLVSPMQSHHGPGCQAPVPNTSAPVGQALMQAGSSPTATRSEHNVHL